MVYGALITEVQSPNHPALRAEGRRRDLDLLIEAEIIRLNEEVFLAILALADFGLHMFIYYATSYFFNVAG